MTLLAPAIKAHSALIMNLNDTLIGMILAEQRQLEFENISICRKVEISEAQHLFQCCYQFSDIYGDNESANYVVRISSL